MYIKNSKHNNDIAVKLCKLPNRIKLYDAIHSNVFDLEVNGDVLYNNILYKKYQH